MNIVEHIPLEQVNRGRCWDTCYWKISFTGELDRSQLRSGNSRTQSIEKIEHKGDFTEVVYRFDIYSD